jgi:biopolymer transport protein TolR
MKISIREEATVPREGRTHREASAVKSDINVTPLVDVCLVLLIIFMVVTPLLKTTNVSLPQTFLPEALPERQGQLTVSIQADGSLFVDSKRVAESELVPALAEAHARSPQRAVVVKGDRRLEYQRVRQVLERVNAAGFTQAGLATEKRKG